MCASGLALTALLAIASLAGCTSPPRDEPPAAAASVVPADTFVNVVWQVAESPTVAVGQLYVFLSDGTLVVTSANSRPALGRWSRTDGGLTMVEDGIARQAEILLLSVDEFRIHISDPGDGVDLRLIRATTDEGRER